MAAPRAPRTFMDSVERFLLRVILVAVALLALLLAFAAWHVRHGGAGAGLATPAATPVSPAITLVIDFGDGTQRRFTDLAFTPGMTVLDAMNLGRAHARPLAFTASGAGDTVMVSEIDGVANQGLATADPGAKPRNWQYWINDRYGEASIGVAKLGPGARVSWAFRPYEPGVQQPPP